MEGFCWDCLNSVRPFVVYEAHKKDAAPELRPVELKTSCR